MNASLPTAPPRELGYLMTNQTNECKLYGWGSAEDSPRSDSVTVYGPSFCGMHAMETYCTISSSNIDTCTAKLGSPIVCNDGFIDGFIIKNAGCSSDSFLLSYHSVGDFREWIELVSGAENNRKLSIIYLVTLALLSVKIFS